MSLTLFYLFFILFPFSFFLLCCLFLYFCFFACSFPFFILLPSFVYFFTRMRTHNSPHYAVANTSLRFVQNILSDLLVSIPTDTAVCSFQRSESLIKNGILSCGARHCRIVKQSTKFSVFSVGDVFFLLFPFHGLFTILPVVIMALKHPLGPFPNLPSHPHSKTNLLASLVTIEFCSLFIFIHNLTRRTKM
jgi:hypothetical protein